MSSLLLELVQASQIILRNALNLTFGSAYSLGENNRRTFLERLGQDAGRQKQRSLWSLYGNRIYIAAATEREPWQFNINNSVHDTFCADTAHCMLSLEGET